MAERERPSVDPRPGLAKTAPAADTLRVANITK
jgi:hypothetical protein